MAIFNTTSATSSVTARQMVNKIMTALATNPVGVVTIVVDGQQVTWSRSQALTELSKWETRAARAAGTRSRVRSIYLG